VEDSSAREWARLVAAARRPGTGFPARAHRDGLLRTRPDSFTGTLLLLSFFFCLTLTRRPSNACPPPTTPRCGGGGVAGEELAGLERSQRSPPAGRPPLGGGCDRAREGIHRGQTRIRTHTSP
jgi:hypothetical protein